MIVKYKFLSHPFDFQDKGVKILKIENQDLFRKTLLQLYHNNEDQWFIVSENFKPMDYSKNVRIVDDILNFTMNDKKLLSKLNQDLEEYVNSYYYEKLQSIREELFVLCKKLSCSFDFNVEYNDTVETSAIIKLMNFRPRDDSENILERFARYLILLNKYIGVKLFITVNLYLYFSQREINMLFETLAYNHINLLDLEGESQVVTDKHSELIIIDKDLCEIIDN